MPRWIRHNIQILALVFALGVATAGCATTAPADDDSTHIQTTDSETETDGPDARQLADEPCGSADWDEPPPQVVTSDDD